MSDGYGHKIKAFSLRMPKELRKKLQAQADDNGRSLTDEINRRLDGSIEEDEKRPSLEDLQASLESLHGKVDGMKFRHQTGPL